MMVGLEQLEQTDTREVVGSILRDFSRLLLGIRNGLLRMYLGYSRGSPPQVEEVLIVCWLVKGGALEELSD